MDNTIANHAANTIVMQHRGGKRYPSLTHAGIGNTFPLLHLGLSTFVIEIQHANCLQREQGLMCLSPIKVTSHRTARTKQQQRDGEPTSTPPEVQLLQHRHLTLPASAWQRDV